MTPRPLHESPQMRRLRNDLAAMERLQDESGVLRFRAMGSPPQRYLIQLFGRSLAREHGKVVARDFHEVEIKLGASYPRTGPELRWLTPIFHPNISEVGLVCLGGYGTHWVPSLHLDELCVMLWDMARYHNYDIRSPYNRDAALWAANQSSIGFPTDARPLRDKRAALGRIVEAPAAPPAPAKPEPPPIPADENPWILPDTGPSAIPPSQSAPTPPAPPPRRPSSPSLPAGQDLIFLD